jgi:hypothetical protein
MRQGRDGWVASGSLLLYSHLAFQIGPVLSLPLLLLLHPTTTPFLASTNDNCDIAAYNRQNTFPLPLVLHLLCASFLPLHTRTPHTRHLHFSPVPNQPPSVLPMPSSLSCAHVLVSFSCTATPSRSLIDGSASDELRHRGGEQNVRGSRNFNPFQKEDAVSF